MTPDFEHCYRAVSSRDPRFDGTFVTTVTTTGIYCRPSCPAQTPKRENVRFYPCAAAAAAAGFRACRRCRPEAAPGSREWDVRGDLAAQALRAIADGVVDEEGVPGLARRLHVSERHLARVLVGEVGAGPLALARTRRAQTARMLLDATDLPVSTVAFAAGFASLRQFNDTMRAQFGAAPSELRRHPAVRDGSGALTLRLAHREPYDVTALLGWLSARAVPGLEQVTTDGYRRVLPGGVVVRLAPADGHWLLHLADAGVGGLATVVARCRRMLDADADPAAVAAVLGDDPLLAPLVARRPGVRVPGTVEGFEVAVRAVVGQQVSVAAARTLLGRMVATYGKPLSTPDGSLTHGFPTAEVLADAPLRDVGLTAARARTLRALAAAHAGGELPLDPGADRGEVLRRLRALPGVGPWTTSYVAMRALGDPDAFPHSDLALRRRLADADPERWRPWRAYAAMYLWTTGDDA